MVNLTKEVVVNARELYAGTSNGRDGNVGLIEQAHTRNDLLYKKQFKNTVLETEMVVGSYCW